MRAPLVIDDRITIPAGDIVWTATRSSGPGGQNVNKVASRVELRFDLPGTTALSEAAKARLRAIAGVVLDADGWVLLKSEKTRDQGRNLEDAREKLRDLVLRALVVPKRRRATKPTFGSKQRRLSDKKRHGDKKRARSVSGD
ncbi:MAG TPA: alternative ribosome rescue aminoacyl-tRNA hydrolase ArfB [Polyangiaceae bacterium]|jgi:ribosome-associated protein|nr:alternative ribosome rescue aminoacyl-tRNA hydrolase ArfB [Polyangiaceae bacterium]